MSPRSGSARADGTGGPAPVELRTARLVLDQPTRDDVARITEYCNDPLFERYMTLPWPYRERDAVFFVDTFVPNGWRTQSEFTWALREAPGAPLLGAVGMRRQPRPRTTDVGYWLGAPHRSNGYMTEAVRAAVAWAFEDRGIDTVIWECVAGNVASAHVASSAGFTYRGAGPLRLTMRDGGHPDAWHASRSRAVPPDAAASWPPETMGGSS